VAVVHRFGCIDVGLLNNLKDECETLTFLISTQVDLIIFFDLIVKADVYYDLYALAFI
jgi:hypothetical protein